MPTHNLRIQLYLEYNLKDLIMKLWKKKEEEEKEEEKEEEDEEEEEEEGEEEEEEEEWKEGQVKIKARWEVWC